jgi:hypothetical protein
VVAPFEADTGMALSLGSGWHASSAPGTDQVISASTTLLI